MNHALNFPFEVKSVSAAGEFEGYASVFGVVDLGRDVIEKGAFSASIKRWRSKGEFPGMYYNHNYDLPIGVWKSMEEDDYGLRATGQLAMKVQRSIETHELMQMGAIRGLSVGFPMSGAIYETEKKSGVRRFSEVDPREVSITPTPMNPDAQITRVKSLLAGEVTKREVEEILRDAGFSRTQAKALIGAGYAGLARRDADAEALEKASDVLATIQRCRRGYDARSNGSPGTDPERNPRI